MTRPLLLVAASLTFLAACQPGAPEVEVDDAARALTNACLAEIGKPILPETVTEDTSLELTQEEQDAFRACVTARAAA